MAQCYVQGPITQLFGLCYHRSGSSNKIDTNSFMPSKSQVVDYGALRIIILLTNDDISMIFVRSFVCSFKRGALVNEKRWSIDFCIRI